MNKAQVLTNLRLAREILAAVPAKDLDLEFFVKNTHCGTLACAAGWLAMSPTFAPIMKLLPTTNTTFVLVPPDAVKPEYGENGYDFSFLDEHFGPTAFDVLFAPRGEGERDGGHPTAQIDPDEYDEDEPYAFDGLTDKDLALWRIDQQINALIKEQHV